MKSVYKLCVEFAGTNMKTIINNKPIQIPVKFNWMVFMSSFEFRINFSIFIVDEKKILKLLKQSKKDQLIMKREKNERKQANEEN